MTDTLPKNRILELARSLHASGSPAYELDHRMESVAAALGQPATFFSTPTALFVAFDDESQGTRLLRVYPGDTNLAMYAELFGLQQLILRNGISAEDAWLRLQEIRTTPDGYATFVQVASFGIVAACVAVLVGGNDTVILSCGAIGLIVGALVLGLSRWNVPTHLINVATGFAASAIACAVQV